MSLELAATGFLLYVGAKTLVLPKPQFSLFNFKFIQFWGIRRKLMKASAGAAIADTVYTVPQGVMVLLLGAGIFVQKTTATAMLLSIKRETGPATDTEHLIDEDSANNEFFVYPQQKAASTLRVVAWRPQFLHEGDSIYLAHSLTAAETINDSVWLDVIEYTDPRYEK